MTTKEKLYLASLPMNNSLIYVIETRSTVKGN